MLPGFLIVGAQRSGTTTLYRLISQHPSVLKPTWHKEVHYFDVAYGRAFSWYRAHFPLQAYANRIERSTGLQPVAFEASPYYMFHPLAPERIARHLPDVRLVALLRNPIERAHSAHAHEVSMRAEHLPFEEALEAEDARLEGEVQRILSDPLYVSHSHRHHAYRSRGHYVDQLMRLETIFGRERLHVIDSDDFFAAPEPLYDSLLEFLGLPHRGYPAFARHNARPHGRMAQSVRRGLDAHFLPYDERLAKWLGRTPSWRR